MEFISEELLRYCETHSQAEPDLLKELSRQTHLKVPQPRMLSGHLQGRFLSMLCKLVQPRFVLEIGTYTGYSAIFLAEGLQSGGKLVTIDLNEETAPFSRRYFERSEFRSSIEAYTGDAARIIPELNHSWDLVFIDADKKNYSRYYELTIGKVRPGGLLIADNVLWSGKILQEKKDPDTLAIHQFNEKVSADPRVESLLLPVRDGLMILRKL